MWIEPCGRIAWMHCYNMFSHSLLQKILVIMTAIKKITGLLLVLNVTITDVLSQDTLHLQSNELEVVIANNQSYGEIHRAGYSGISELYMKDDSNENLFVSAFSGLNFEFIFSGDSTSYDWNIFEPRKSPMDLTRLDSNKVQLMQKRTENWPLQSTITYELSGNLVEMSYQGVPLENSWNKYDYIGLFFASYMYAPDEKGISFLGKTRSDSGKTLGKWIYHLPQDHGEASNHRPSDSNWDPPFDPGFPLTLVSGFSEFEYSYPFYFGRSGEKVIIMMFRSFDEESELRFAQSPNGGGPEHPAWDFIYFKKDYEVNVPFGFKVGMIVKKFEGKQDVIRQYEKWSGDQVE